MGRVAWSTCSRPEEAPPALTNLSGPSTISSTLPCSLSATVEQPFSSKSRHVTPRCFTYSCTERSSSFCRAAPSAYDAIVAPSPSAARVTRSPISPSIRASALMLPRPVELFFVSCASASLSPTGFKSGPWSVSPITSVLPSHLPQPLPTCKSTSGKATAPSIFVSTTSTPNLDPWSPNASSSSSSTHNPPTHHAAVQTAKIGSVCGPGSWSSFNENLLNSPGRAIRQSLRPWGKPTPDPLTFTSHGRSFHVSRSTIK
mmetsp:Transcript_40822/g.68219  ORF Transcript_40822/g.68219 Transcript_40822/m.68219 type:complete len:258 (+) Transcript_40822:912-1685(+)